MEALDKIVEMNPVINVAFISVAGSYQIYRPLQESGNFSDYSNNALSGFPFPIMGIYREKLVIVSIRQKSMGDIVIALKDWNESLKLEPDNSNVIYKIQKYK